MTVKVKVTVYTALICSYWLVSMMCFNSKATPTTDNNYSWHIKVVELVYNQSYRVHIMQQIINSLRGGHTNTHTHRHLHKTILRKHVV